MSVLRPVAKQARTTPMSAATRTESVADLGYVEEKDHRTTLALDSTVEEKARMERTPPHPRGHKSRRLTDVWAMMDNQPFLHLTDSLTLGDIWVYPTGIEEPGNSAYVSCTFREIILAPHIKQRNATTKIPVEDLLRILHLIDCIQCDIQQESRISYDDWLKEKSALCVKAKGMEFGKKPANLASFILSEDKTFRIFPDIFNGTCGIFIRKIAYHSYKGADKNEDKIENPCMIKSCSAKGKFEYIYEARIIPLPVEWFHKHTEDIGDVPETLPL